jgi:hypothetical protein
MDKSWAAKNERLFRKRLSMPNLQLFPELLFVQNKVSAVNRGDNLRIPLQEAGAISSSQNFTQNTFHAMIPIP